MLNEELKKWNEIIDENNNYRDPIKIIKNNLQRCITIEPLTYWKEIILDFGHQKGLFHIRLVFSL